jgi:hypothetical protein
VAAGHEDPYRDALPLASAEEVGEVAVDPVPHDDGRVRVGDQGGVAAPGGRLVGAVAVEVQGVGDEGEPAFDRVTGSECVSAASSPGEDHDVG